MLKEFTCIICPRGCVIEVDASEGINAEMAPERGTDRTDRELALNAALASATGMGCRRGVDYVRQEVLNPKRTIATSVKVVGGSMPLVSVRLTKPVPKTRISDIMAALRAEEVRAPVEAGEIIVRNIRGTGSDVIATRRVPRAAETRG